MDRKQEFSIASKQSEDQKRAAEDQERLQKIEQLRDADQRQHHREAMMLRDEKLKIEADRAKREEQGIVQKEVQKKLIEKHEMHLTMNKAEGLSPEKKEEMVHRMVSHNVRISHGAELDQHGQQIRNDMNAEIDRGIKDDLAKQERSQEAKPSIERPWRQASRDNENERPWRRSDEGRNREP